MTVRWSRLAAALTGMLFASLLHAQFAYQARQFGDMEAQLTVQAANKATEPGLGAATLTLTVKGPDSLEVEPPHLSDATAAWKEERLTSTRVVQNKRATWSQVIRLKQSKKGIEALPDVSLRFRNGPDAPWEECKWVDILKHMRDPSGPAPATPEEPSWLRRWGVALVLAATALLVLLAWLTKRRRERRPAPQPPAQWALRELDRIERMLMPPHGEAEAYHTQLSYVLRRYLTERFGLHALQQTTAEFLDALRQAPLVSAEQQILLADFFQRCDLAKFARASTPAEECQRTAEMARELIRRTTETISVQHS
jgi:hypothetical protein